GGGLEVVTSGPIVRLMNGQFAEAASTLIDSPPPFFSGLLLFPLHFDRMTPICTSLPEPVIANTGPPLSPFSKPAGELGSEFVLSSRAVSNQKGAGFGCSISTSAFFNLDVPNPAICTT